jgi:hypothetical protein
MARFRRSDATKRAFRNFASWLRFTAVRVDELGLPCKVVRNEAMHRGLTESSRCGIMVVGASALPDR